MEPSSPPEEKRSILRHPALRRLPIIAVAAMGIWLWQGGAKEREIYWLLPSDRSGIERVKIELRDEKGKLLRGDEHFYEGRQVPSEIVTQARLPDGTYQAQIRVRRKGGADETLRREVRLEDDAASVRLD